MNIEDLYDEHKALLNNIKSETIDLTLATRAYRIKLFDLSAKICIKEITVLDARDANVAVIDAREAITKISIEIVGLNDKLTDLSERIIRSYTEMPVRNEVFK